MSDDKTKKPPEGLTSEVVRIQDIYSFVSTKLNEALLELESLAILGLLVHGESNHFVDAEVIADLEVVLEKVHRNRLQYQHGVPPDTDNVFFLEQHPYFSPKDDESE